VPVGTVTLQACAGAAPYHVRALRRTWKATPGSFLNLKRFLKELFLPPKPALIAAIGQMVLMSPESLSVLGVEGFAREPEDEEWEG